jgi:hypothetical protein
MFQQIFPIAVSIVAIVIIVVVLAPQRRIAVPDDLSVALEVGGGMAVALIRKGWGVGNFRKVAGTVTIRNPNTSHYSVAPSQVTTTATAPDALFTITPSSIGTSEVQVWGRSAFGSHAGFFSSGPWVKITVTG